MEDVARVLNRNNSANHYIVSREKRGIVRKIIRHRYLYLLLLPSVIFLFIFSYLPMYGAIIAFKDFNPVFGILGSKWVGLKYFAELIHSMFFWRVFRNTFLINIYHLIFGFPAPLIFALLLNEIRKNKFKRTIQTITYLPHFLSWVIIGGMVVTVLSPNQGLINVIANMFGQRIDEAILADPHFFRGILVISSIWKELGFGSIIYLAAISGINEELYDAALMDGANRWQQTIHVTIPCILPTIAALLILRLGNMMGSNFEQVFVLYQPTVYSVGDVISTFVYREGLYAGHYSFTTAVGLFQSVIGFILLVSANTFARRAGNSLW